MYSHLYYSWRINQYKLRFYTQTIREEKLCSESGVLHDCVFVWFSSLLRNVVAAVGFEQQVVFNIAIASVVASCWDPPYLIKGPLNFVKTVDKSHHGNKHFGRRSETSSSRALSILDNNIVDALGSTAIAAALLPSAISLSSTNKSPATYNSRKD